MTERVWRPWMRGQRLHPQIARRCGHRRAIRLVAGGGTLFTPDVVASLLKRGREIRAQSESLTPREKEELRLLGAGVSSREMATKLGISYTTVRAHLRSIDAKLGVHSKVEAVLKARELRLIEQRRL